MTDQPTCPPLGAGSIDFASLQRALSVKGKVDIDQALEEARTPVSPRDATPDDFPKEASPQPTADADASKGGDIDV